jgi:ribosomal protein S18 acetylase RimI-like enzyme
MTPDLEIERTTIEAAGEILWKLTRELLEDGATYIFRPDTSRQEVLRYWFPGSGATYLAAVQGEPVGCYLLQPTHPGRGSHVANASYYVASPWRGRGFGRTLCEHSIEMARKAGYRAMLFNLVVATNSGAIALWKSLGFEVLGTIPQAFDHSELGLTNALIMHRML